MPNDTPSDQSKLTGDSSKLDDAGSAAPGLDGDIETSRTRRGLKMGKTAAKVAASYVKIGRAHV